MSPHPTDRYLRAVLEGAPDAQLAEIALETCWDVLPQPESLDRFVRAARQGGCWAAAAANAAGQVWEVVRREKRL